MWQSKLLTSWSESREKDRKEAKGGGGGGGKMEVWVPKSPSRSSPDLSSLRTFFKHTVTHSSLFLSEPGFIVYL